jgi:hypothetical protein
MQNKPNFESNKIVLSSLTASKYEKIEFGEKAKTNPIQSQYKPKQTQFWPKNQADKANSKPNKTNNSENKFLFDKFGAVITLKELA